jgi:hypothetical protein
MRDTVGFEMLAVMRVVVAGLAKMCGAKAKPDGRRAAPAALEFEEIGAWTREKESFCATISVTIGISQIFEEGGGE